MNKNSLQIIKYRISIIHLVLVFSTFSSPASAMMENDCHTWDFVYKYWYMMSKEIIQKDVPFRKGEPREKGPPHFDYIMRDEKWAYPVKSDGTVLRHLIFDPTVDFISPRYDPDFADFHPYKKWKRADGKLTEKKLQLFRVLFPYAHKISDEPIMIEFIEPKEQAYENSKDFNGKPQFVNVRSMHMKVISRGYRLPLSIFAEEEKEYFRKWLINYKIASQMVNYRDTHKFKYVKAEIGRGGKWYHPVKKDGTVLKFLWLNPMNFNSVISRFDPDFKFRQEYTFTSKDGKKLFGCYEYTKGNGIYIKTLEGPIVRVHKNRLIEQDIWHIHKIERQKCIWFEMNFK